MKKTVSIHISGILFHIEEDGYDRLNDYLASIHRYFATYPDSKEIISDIESRMAELFSARLTPTNQVISLHDVDQLIKKMGNVQDFQEMESELLEEGPMYGHGGEAHGTATAYEQATRTQTGTRQQTRTQRKFYRDLNRKVLGGVASGLAHYFHMDTIWMRLLFLLPPFLDWMFLPGSLTSITVISYIVLWVVVPGRRDMYEDEKIKKLYRDPENRALGGVASGISHFFGVDMVIVRILFVLGIFLGGAGILVYLVLWAIMPEARTLTERMRMQGEPVTLDNIEARIRESFQPGPDGKETVLMKILLFPFRLIATIFNSISTSGILQFLGDAIRVLTAVLLIFIGFVLIISSLGLTSGLLTIFSMDGVFINEELPLDLLRRDFPTWVSFPAVLALFVPGVALGLSGLSLLAKRSLMKPILGFTLFGIWIVSLVALSIAVPTYLNQYRTRGEFEQVETYHIPARTIVLDARESGEASWQKTELKISGYEGHDLRLVKRFSARGLNRKSAVENASMIDHQVVRRDSTLIFDQNFEFQSDALFRRQELLMELYVPYGQEFRMDPSLEPILRSTLTPAGYNTSQLATGRWVFTQDGLTCLNCEKNRADDATSASSPASDQVTGQVYDTYQDFHNISVGDMFRVYITQGDRYQVAVNAPNQDISDNIHINQQGNELEISLDNSDRWTRWRRDYDEIRVDITTPRLERLYLHGACQADVSGFTGDVLSLDMEGAPHARVEANLKRLTLDLSGASELELIGTGDELNADLSGAAQLRAHRYEVSTADLDVSGASDARVYATRRLKADASGASQIRYRGTPEDLDLDSGNISSIKRED
ncbi:Phage shock protein PspC (stress-responsive transcriptional regulator) [Catalinimonas alkaloidigena]|uniref:Phage shock protein PspC (Stress-responsive transcriptional regulator) n=1 Tax=Catalinimonas alkaloidigena TaxID=1075417 RepID=A0A1G8XWF2_9BACT|nr:DUF2807 domain-containing protein [Catalinimonas alkaloidigena]SDJ94833.1 Phage shock protein PspC (stress-responsive transcriptional regulator) [Catalinimonas alkaloidigena]